MEASEVGAAAVAERDRLVSLARRYLLALVAGRPEDVPLAAGYRQSMNGRE